ncbi:MAG TPA: pantoate--beta-alanine ligase [Phycisphaerales bacterium]|nr:pantoate--beta-alanine ligase [Phycisphaerales bacterium]
MEIVRDIAGLGPYAGNVFVPTMGALHDGHAALIRAAAKAAADETRRGREIAARPVVVSVFVNPTQFNDRSDFDRYPRTLERDAAIAEEAGADVVFAPGVDLIYARDGDGKELAPAVRDEQLPEVARLPRLEDAHRPGHFAGVYQVVKRLFELVRPAAAIFGEKDWQQLQLIRALVAREKMPIEIIPHATIREPDGLAMSSRNARLSADERARAVSLWRAILASQRHRTSQEAEAAGASVLRAAGVEPEYISIRDTETLLPIIDAGLRGRQGRVLVAANVGTTRLIDNAAWPDPGLR